MPGAPLERLDSWKQIADYLGRDVRTAMRWSKLHGLPVRRVAGGRSRSVFAYRTELDGWLTGIGAGLSEAPSQPVPAEPADPDAVLSATPVPIVTRTRPWPLGAWMVVAAVIIIGASSALMSGFSARAAAAPVGATLNQSGITVRDAKGAERLVWPFDRSGEAVIGPEARAELLDLDGDGTTEIVASVPFYRREAQRAVLGGELIALDANGETRWRFSKDDQLRIGGRLYAPPWVVSAWSASPSPVARRIAVASHHFEWWPSVVNVLDQIGRPTGTFINAGWVNAVHWIGKDRLAITGVNNARNGGMFALIDAENIDGHSPDTAEGFLCETCPAGAPVFYATFARSELNLLTGATFNNAVVDVTADRFVVQTMEIEPGAFSGASAIYEFTRDLQLVSARYSDRYWDLHRRLEHEGKIRHTRENCSQRDGPLPVSVWKSASGWTSVSPR